MSSTSTSSGSTAPGSSADASTDGAVGKSFDAKAAAVVTAMSLFGVMPGMVVAVVLALTIGPLYGIVGLLLVAGAWWAFVRMQARGALDKALTSIGGSPIGEADFPRWANVVDGLGVSSGVNDAELWVLDSDHANAVAVASSDRSVIVVTRPLLDALSVVEMEAVAANLLGRIKDGSARYGTVTFGVLGGFLGSIDAAGKLVADGLGDQRDVRSDFVAVALTRYPPGLARALEHLDRIGTTVAGTAPATAHLWLAPVVDGDAGVDPAIAASVAQPLSYRAAVLDEL